MTEATHGRYAIAQGTPIHLAVEVHAQIGHDCAHIGRQASFSSLEP
jgi:hypothetical protein